MCTKLLCLPSTEIPFGLVWHRPANKTKVLVSSAKELVQSWQQPRNTKQNRNKRYTGNWQTLSHANILAQAVEPGQRSTEVGFETSHSFRTQSNSPYP